MVGCLHCVVWTGDASQITANNSSDEQASPANANARVARPIGKDQLGRSDEVGMYLT